MGVGVCTGVFGVVCVGRSNTFLIWEGSLGVLMDYVMGNRETGVQMMIQIKQDLRRSGTLDRGVHSILSLE